MSLEAHMLADEISRLTKLLEKQELRIQNLEEFKVVMQNEHDYLGY